LVFISIGGFGAALLCLFQARRLLRGQNAEAFALPNGPTVVAQFGVKWPAALDGAPILELAVLAAALLGAPLWAWSLLAAAATARLWRWFVGGGDRTAARADNDARS
jgi:hypothetical protein